MHDDIGYNWRPGELNAILGLAQMRRADEILKRRRHIARSYDEKISARRIPGIKLLKIPNRVQSSYYKYVVYLEPPLERTRLKQELKGDHGVSLGGDLYNRPCHSQPLFARHPETIVSQPAEMFPETDYVVSNHICLPLYFDLTDDQVEYVVDSLRVPRSLKSADAPSLDRDGGRLSVPGKPWDPSGDQRNVGRVSAPGTLYSCRDLSAQ